MNNYLKTGLIGSGVLAICCFTPVLVIVLGAAGLSAWVAELDIVLLPLLGCFVALTLIGVIKKLRAESGSSS